MKREADSDSIVKTHPCFSEKAHLSFGRVHLPVAPACNIQCRYCIRKFDCANESRPGITSRVLSPDEALERVRALVERNDRLSVVGIAGPGDALANPATYPTLRRINHEFPDLTLCLSTNGLLLPDRLEQILAAGVRSLTITINAVSMNTAEALYSWVEYDGTAVPGPRSSPAPYQEPVAGIVSRGTCGNGGQDQQCSRSRHKRSGNTGHRRTRGKPGCIHHEHPPSHSPGRIQAPCAARPGRLWRKCGTACGPFVKQMSHCRQCRADACGLLGEDKDMELEVLMARIGEDYADSVL